MKRKIAVHPTRGGITPWLLADGRRRSDQILGTAILNRLLHLSTTINIRRHSYRLRQKRKAGAFIWLTQPHKED